MNNCAAAARLRLCRQRQDVDPRRLRAVLHAQPGHRVRPHRRRVQRQLDADVHARLQRHALRDAGQPLSRRHAAAAGARAGRRHPHRPRRRHHPAEQQPQSRVPLVERVAAARDRLELDPRSQLHRQPRHAPVPADHDPDAAAPGVLVDGAYGVERRGPESVLRTDHRSAGDPAERADGPAVPAAAADAAVQRRQRGDVGAADRRFLLPRAAGEVGQALLARVQLPGPLHLGRR